jgi:choline dehydrogenase-like flavoprotein
MSSRKAYWDPASDRPNLSILVNTYVATVALQGPHVIGVNAITRRTNETLLIGSNKEVILAAGAAHTPQILQLSGIGPKDLLENLGIDVSVDLPGVGSNFQDHLGVSSNWRCKGVFRALVLT